MPIEKVLMFDDDAELCELIKSNIQAQPYEFYHSQDPEKDFKLIETINPQLIMLDVGFPYCNGFDILKKIRKEFNIPVIMLTARGDELDRVLGLELGADDYLPKPFFMRELLARIKAILRRTTDINEPIKGRVLEYADLEINQEFRSLHKDGELIILTSKEFDLLFILIENANSIISKEELSQKIFKRSFDTIDRSLDVHLSRIRKKLGLTPDGKERIRTIRGTGVIFS